VKIIWLLLSVLLALPLALPPDALPVIPLCIFRSLSGLNCPGCGLTHAFLAAGRGQWRVSALYHPLGPALYAALLALWGSIAMKRLAGNPPGLRRGPSQQDGSLSPPC
jgi:hypothetical protein